MQFFAHPSLDKEFRLARTSICVLKTIQSFVMFEDTGCFFSSVDGDKIGKEVGEANLTTLYFLLPVVTQQISHTSFMGCGLLDDPC